MKKKDTAENIVTYSVITQIESIRKLHENLLREIANELQGKHTPILGIFGTGGEISPYGYFPSWFKENIREGNVVLLDYNPKVLSAGFKYLSAQRVFECFSPEILLKSKNSLEGIMQGETGPSSSLVRVNPEESIDSSNLVNQKFLFCEANFKYPLNFVDNILDVVDSTLTLHHVFAYTSNVKRVFQEIYRVLKPGGLFHLGEASVNMRRSEENIGKLTDLLGDVYIIDKRDPEAIVKRGNQNAKYQLVLTEEGYFEIDDDGNTRSKLADQYEITIQDGKIVFPLIDSKRDYDFVEEVNQYYLKNNIEKADLLGTEDPLKNSFTAKRIQDSIKQGLQERDYAEKGLVEFYSPQEYLISILRDVGFEVRSQLANPFRMTAPMVNIYARK